MIRVALFPESFLFCSARSLLALSQNSVKVRKAKIRIIEFGKEE
jgi:hypothetical protein